MTELARLGGESPFLVFFSYGIWLPLRGHDLNTRTRVAMPKIA
jgi:hypothetical protein